MHRARDSTALPLYKYADPGTLYKETGQRPWLGANQLGQGLLMRLFYGERISLSNLRYAVAVEAALTFLGVGTLPDVPSWDRMLSITGTGQKYVEVSPWLVVFPSAAVSLAVFGFHLLGEALRDALNPRLKGVQS